jgi:hypothetical protein
MPSFAPCLNLAVNGIFRPEAVGPDEISKASGNLPVREKSAMRDADFAGDG